MTPNLFTRIGPISINNPTILASGILGISINVFNRIYESGAGAVVTKSISVLPSDGYDGPNMFSIGDQGWLNAIGLSNPGVDNFSKILKQNKKIPIVVSLVGSNEHDFVNMIQKLRNMQILAYEINLSCPHVEKVGLDVGDDPDLVYRIIKNIDSITEVPIIAKVGLGSTNYLDTVRAACDGGADAITAINTLRAMSIDIETMRPILGNKIGGLSGKPIKTIAVRCVYEISSKYDIPIIGCGGISSWQDAIEFILAGASAVQIGSIINYKWLKIFSDINDGIIKYMSKKKIYSIGEMVGISKRF
ncbi:MAG: dihydroorotate dehydrogenase [Thaumarchaeota archaeon]|nr:dihydroorotate dehydrogenase [Nitrososphaerota archaeon]MCY3975976.1 dihydroorotate dehydrogenase [Nitrososphaerota archaeon]